MRYKKTFITIFFLFLVLAVTGTFLVFRIISRKNNSPDSNQITVYLDSSNQLYVRSMIAAYDNLSAIAKYSGESDIYPEIEWNLIDKSYLSAEEYRKELLSELGEGGGPDILFLDEYSCKSPIELLEAGYCADLNAWINSETCAYNIRKFLPGTLEAGKMEGVQYLIPVSVDIPVLCTTVQRLQSIGLTEENMNDTEAIMEAAVLWLSRKGSFPFDSSGLLYHLDSYIGEQEEWSPELSEYVQILLEAEHQDIKDNLAAAYKFAEAEFLFLTSGISDYRTMAWQLKQLSTEEEILFLPLSHLSGGGQQALIRQAVAVNQNSIDDHPFVFEALNAFFDQTSINYSQNLPSLTVFSWLDLIDLRYYMNPSVDFKRELTRSETWNFAKCTAHLVTLADYPEEYTLPENSLHTSCDGGRVLNLTLSDCPLEQKSLLARWVSEVIPAFEKKTGIHVEISYSIASVYINRLLMSDYLGDLTLCVYYPCWENYTSTKELSNHFFRNYELIETSPLSDLNWKEGVLESSIQKSVSHVPFSLNDIFINGFLIPSSCEYPQETLEFITMCLQSDLYSEVLDTYGGECVFQ